jgi:hypothetical protein
MKLPSEPMLLPDPEERLQTREPTLEVCRTRPTSWPEQLKFAGEHEVGDFRMGSGPRIGCRTSMDLGPICCFAMQRKAVIRWATDTFLSGGHHRLRDIRSTKIWWGSREIPNSSL